MQLLCPCVAVWLLPWQACACVVALPKVSFGSAPVNSRIVSDYFCKCDFSVHIFLQQLHTVFPSLLTYMHIAKVYILHSTFKKHTCISLLCCKNMWFHQRVRKAHLIHTCKCTHVSTHELIHRDTGKKMFRLLCQWTHSISYEQAHSCMSAS